MQDLRPRKWQNRLCDEVLYQKQSHKTDRTARKQSVPYLVHLGEKYRFMPQNIVLVPFASSADASADAIYNA
jgi:hypothetical protein